MWDARHQRTLSTSSDIITCDGTGKAGQVAGAGLPWRCLEKFKVGMTNTISLSNSWKAYLVAGGSEPLSRYSSITVDIISGGISWSERSGSGLFRSHSFGKPPTDSHILYHSFFLHPGAHAPGDSHPSTPPCLPGCFINRLCLGRISSSVELSVSPVVTVSITSGRCLDCSDSVW